MASEVSRPKNELLITRQHTGGWRRDISVRTAMVYGLDGWGSIPGGGKKFISTPQRQSLLWDLL
jgi:hypothetical protein